MSLVDQADGVLMDHKAPAHTSGPWVVLGAAVADKATDYAIAVRDADNKPHIIAEAFGRSDWEHPYNSEANARLIAAAPELAEALAALLYACDSPELITKARAALEKAGVQ